MADDRWSSAPEDPKRGVGAGVVRVGLGFLNGIALGLLAVPVIALITAGAALTLPVIAIIGGIALIVGGLSAYKAYRDFKKANKEAAETKRKFDEALREIREEKSGEELAQSNDIALLDEMLREIGAELNNVNSPLTNIAADANKEQLDALLKKITSARILFQVLSMEPTAESANNADNDAGNNPDSKNQQLLSSEKELVKLEAQIIELVNEENQRLRVEFDQQLTVLEALEKGANKQVEQKKPIHEKCYELSKRILANYDNIEKLQFLSTDCAKNPTHFTDPQYQKVLRSNNHARRELGKLNIKKEKHIPFGEDRSSFYQAITNDYETDGFAAAARTFIYKLGNRAMTFFGGAAIPIGIGLFIFSVTTPVGWVALAGAIAIGVAAVAVGAIATYATYASEREYKRKTDLLAIRNDAMSEAIVDIAKVRDASKPKFANTSQQVMDGSEPDKALQARYRTLEEENKRLEGEITKLKEENQRLKTLTSTEEVKSTQKSSQHPEKEEKSPLDAHSMFAHTQDSASKQREVPEQSAKVSQETPTVSAPIPRKKNNS